MHIWPKSARPAPDTAASGFSPRQLRRLLPRASFGVILRASQDSQG